jgi:hypothetical protein
MAGMSLPYGARHWIPSRANRASTAGRLASGSTRTAASRGNRHTDSSMVYRSYPHASMAGMNS